MTWNNLRESFLDEYIEVLIEDQLWDCNYETKQNIGKSVGAIQADLKPCID